MIDDIKYSVVSRDWLIALNLLIYYIRVRWSDKYHPHTYRLKWKNISLMSDLSNVSNVWKMAEMSKISNMSKNVDVGSPKLLIPTEVIYWSNLRTVCLCKLKVQTWSRICCNSLIRNCKTKEKQEKYLTHTLSLSYVIKM